MVQFDEDKQKMKLAELRQQEEEDFVRAAAQNRNLPYFDLTKAPVEGDALQIIPEEEARVSGIVAFQLVDRKLGVGVTNPDDEKTKQTLQNLAAKGFAVSPFLVSHRSLEHTFSQYKDLSLAKTSTVGTFEVSSEEVENVLGSVKSVNDVKKLTVEALAKKKNYRTTHAVEIILAGALATGASDIHLEPEQEAVRLRYRLDGVLNDILNLDFKTYGYVLSRIKLISGLKLNIKTEAQDGRFSINTKRTEIEVRTSILPGNYGESIVMRVLDPESISVSVEELGFEPHLHELLEKEVAKPNGMILTTGPTGSGKTTTLYAFLKKVYTPDVKIITIEDPVEYHLKGIVQSQVNPEKGYTFSAGLRAAMRQDPDIIMVGEIRDNETAEIAVNAAVTGHLVFSTLHTNDAAGSFPRLLGLGVNPKVMSSALTVAMAQRLTRRLCTNCKKETPLSGADKQTVASVMATVPIESYRALPQKSVWKAVGCDKCNMTGYKGRIGIFEAIVMTQKIEEVALKNPSEREVRAAAQDQGLLTMAQDGVIKVLQGITSLDELRRVIDLESTG